MLAVLCPGQGAQRPGMVQPWCAVEGADGLLRTMSEAAGLDLRSLGTQADADTLRRTETAQPLIVATGLLSALAAGLLSDLEHPASPGPGPTGEQPGLVIAGHSLGHLTALAVAGALTPAEAVGLAAVRGRAMSRCAAENDGGMTALLGGDRQAVLEAVAAAGLTTANVNGSSQVIVSGATEGLRRLEVPEGVRAVPLTVGGAFHSPLMAGAAQEVATATAGLPRRALGSALVDDADGSVHPAGAEAGPLLDAVAAKVTRPVRWDLVQVALNGLGLGRAVELAPAGTLAGLARRDLPGLPVTRLRSPADGA